MCRASLLQRLRAAHFHRTSQMKLSPFCKLDSWPLRVPVQQSHDACLKVLAKVVHGDTPLISATAKGNYDLTQEFITAGTSVNVVDIDGKSALHHSRNLKCTELLIREGANVNLKDNMGYTPLHFTAEFGTIDCCLSLISAGADVNIAANNGERLLSKLHI